MKNLVCGLALLSALFVQSSASAFEVSFGTSNWCTNDVVAGGYLNNIPEGWTFSSTAGAFTLYSSRTGIDGTSALRFESYNIAANKTAVLRMGSDICVPREDIVSDTVVASIMLYVQPVEGKKIDKFQFIATTNDWNDTILIGDAIPIRDNSYSKGWRKFQLTAKTIEGLSGSSCHFRIGVQMTTGGYSMTYGYLHSMSVEFVACASPDKPELVLPYSSETIITPGVEKGRMKVRVNAAPLDKIDELQVFGVLSRDNGERTIVATNGLELAADGNYECSGKLCTEISSVRENCARRFLRLVA